MNIALGSAPDFKGWICVEEKLQSYLHHCILREYVAVCYMYFRARQFMYECMHLHVFSLCSANFYAVPLTKRSCKMYLHQ